VDSFDEGITRQSSNRLERFGAHRRAPWLVVRPLNLIEGGRTRYQATAETISAQHHLKEQAIDKEVIDS
jgi:hypothetical protein